jgi:hypothetical protein
MTPAQAEELSSAIHHRVLSVFPPQCPKSERGVVLDILLRWSRSNAFLARANAAPRSVVKEEAMSRRVASPGVLPTGVRGEDEIGRAATRLP